MTEEQPKYETDKPINYYLINYHWQLGKEFGFGSIHCAGPGFPPHEMILNTIGDCPDVPENATMIVMGFSKFECQADFESYTGGEHEPQPMKAKTH